MRRTLLKLLLGLSLPLAAAPAGWAAILPPSPNHPERQWQVLETSHFFVHFYQGHEKLAQEVAETAEASFSQVTNDLGARPKAKVPVILTADSFWNGYAEPLKDRIVLDPLLAKTSMMGLRRFFTHEFTHIITFPRSTPPRRSPAGSWRVWHSTRPSTGIPVWTGCCACTRWITRC